MEKPVILKEAPKSKVYNKKDNQNKNALTNKSKKTKTVLYETNSNKEKYLNFYDDIKIPSKKYDW